MFRLNVVFFCVLFTGGTALLADTKAEFARAAIASGPEYVELRDQLRKSEANLQDLTSMLESTVAEERMTSIIILGWRQNGEKYAKLADDDGIEDQKGVRRYSWSYDPEMIDPEMLPLMYEMLLKDTHGVGGRDAAKRVISFLASKKTVPDVAALTTILVNSSTPSDPRRVAIAQTISALPQEFVSANDVANIALTEAQRADCNKDVVNGLMNGLVRLGGKLPMVEKDGFVRRLYSDSNLKGQVGDTAVVHVLGAIGGDAASEVVKSHLENTADVLEKRWALAALGNIGNTPAVDTLIHYVGDESLSPTVRIYAIDGLRRCTFSEKIGDTLEDIILKGNTGLRERNEAVDAIDAMHRFSMKSPAIAKSIEDRINRISAARISQPQLREKVDKVREAIDNR
jgi:HEAT repeat protein